MTEIIKHRGRLQFITHKTPHLDELAGAEAVLRGGCRWIQLRMKQATTNEIIEMGHKMRQLCDKYEATLIIDDHVELVKEIKAAGNALRQDATLYKKEMEMSKVEETDDGNKRD